MSLIEPFLPRTRVAYFSMETALDPQIHTYSGGLGMLAGDTARSCADLDLPVVFVTLVSRNGYLRQEIDGNGLQRDHADPRMPCGKVTPLDVMVVVEIEERAVWIRPWLYLVTCPVGHSVPVLLLDTRLDNNCAADREITDRLYGGDQTNRLKQEVVLGVGGNRILRALGFDIETYHLNEGNAAFLTLALLREHPHSTERPGDGAIRYNADSVRERCVFTTHTPVEAGHDRFLYEDLDRILGQPIPSDQLKLLGNVNDGRKRRSFGPPYEVPERQICSGLILASGSPKNPFSRNRDLHSHERVDGADCNERSQPPSLHDEGLGARPLAA